MDTKERVNTAVELRGRGYNCCQSTLCACRDLTGLDMETSAALGYGFAGGMYCGEVCGAVTGGLMAVGACLPAEDPKGTRPLAVAAARDFQARFRERFGTLLCREIIGKTQDKSHCNQCVACGAEAAAAVIEKFRSGGFDK